MDNTKNRSMMTIKMSLEKLKNKSLSKMDQWEMLEIKLMNKIMEY